MKREIGGVHCVCVCVCVCVDLRTLHLLSHCVVLM